MGVPPPVLIRFNRLFHEMNHPASYWVTSAGNLTETACFTIPYATHGNKKQQQLNTPYLWPNHVGLYILYMEHMAMVFGRYN